MKLPAILCSDLHLTANPRDAYRWDLFPWLVKQAAKNNARTVAILGDLTDAKDYHSSQLVNMVACNIKVLASNGVQVLILKGNHDYLQTGHAFFEFLSLLPNVTFINTPLDTSSEGEACMWLPHSKQPAKDWHGMDLSHYRHVFMHQTVSGSIASNGQAMPGESLPDILANAGKVWSGDIHVPQVIGGVEYVGSPYHVHFGDSFKPRCIVLEEDGSARDIRFRTLSRRTVDIEGPKDIEGLNLASGDQVKVRVHLKRHQVHEWQAIRRDVNNRLTILLVEVCGIELVAPKPRVRAGLVNTPHSSNPEDVVLRYVEQQELGGDMLNVGLDLL